MPVPGDVVHVQILEDGQTVVERIDPRIGTLERRSASGRTKTIAANVDLLVAVTALASPAPRLPTLDQLLAFAELEEIEAAVVFTKPDLAEPELSRELLELYGGLKYPSVAINPKSGEIDPLRRILLDRRALLVGNSGVGKSTIFRALGGESVVGEVSRQGLGRQTTSSARLYRTPNGFLIDSPGVNEFGLGQVEPGRLAHSFREMRPLVSACRFTDCTHVQEPDCAVKEATEAGRIAQSRYESYCRILLAALDTRRATLL
jgi:ribosome biogenesis GTPase / thiamine phosphate phosphatase